MTLTRREMDVLRAIHAYRETHGISPTLAEIAAAIGVEAPSWVHALVVSLRAKRLVVRSGPGSRSLALGKIPRSLRKFLTPSLAPP